MRVRTTVSRFPSRVRREVGRSPSKRSICSSQACESPSRMGSVTVLWFPVAALASAGNDRSEVCSIRSRDALDLRTLGIYKKKC